MKKKLSDIILQKLTDASTSGCSALKVYLYGADMVEEDPIACIPIVPDTAGGFIAGMYKEEYAKLTPYFDHYVVDENIYHDINGKVHRYISMVFIKEDELEKVAKKAGEKPRLEVSLIHDGDVDYYVSPAYLRDQLQNAIDGCSKRPNCCGVYVRSIASLKLLGQFPLKTPDTPEEELKQRAAYYMDFIREYGSCKIIAERMLTRTISPQTSEFFEIFVDDYDHSYAANNPIGRDDDNRVKLLCFFLNHFSKMNSFKMCDSMSIVMKNADDTIMDYLDLKF